MIFGYARCSTSADKQNISRQVDLLRGAGAEKIFTEYEHGDSSKKSQQALMLSEAAAGDTVIITEASRIARSVSQFCSILETIRKGHLRLQILDSITLDCRYDNPDPMSVAFLQIAGVFSELELQMTRERVRSGVRHAMDSGKRIGRPKLTRDGLPRDFDKYYHMYLEKAISLSEMARLLGCSRTTLYGYIKLYDE